MSFDNIQNTLNSPNGIYPPIITPELEVLAPAGDFEKLRYALAFGADAVYAGMPQFSLRARENGFTSLEDIRQGIEYCHGRGKKFYLAANIIPHNNKIRTYRNALDEICSEYKPDALIMTDPGMIQYVLKNHKNTEVHLSVQGNCTNWSTAEFWYDLGVKRMILSRELRLREIIDIRENVPGVELEVFVHGAICMAHSGRCLLSNYMSYRDANQGACSNACRFDYKLYAKNTPQSPDYVPLEGEFFLEEQGNKEQGLMGIDEDEYGTYIMNSKDMCAIGVLDKLREAGVCSFKIEGRTKSIYYLSQIVKSYRGATDDVMADREISSEHIDNALKTDSRGYMAGYFVAPGELPQNYTSTRVVSQTGTVAAIFRGYDAESKIATISVKGQFSEGDTLELSTPTRTEMIVAQNLVNHRREKVTVLNPGLDNCKIYMEQDPGEYAFLIRK